MPELVGFQTMVILDPYDMTFDAVGVFGPDFWLLFKSASSYCGGIEPVTAKISQKQLKFDLKTITTTPSRVLVQGREKLVDVTIITSHSL